jgi:hypothetical protein
MGMVTAFIKNVWHSATCGIARIQLIERVQITVALLIQTGFFVLSSEHSRTVLGFASAASYASAYGLSSHRPPGSSILPPVTLGMTLVMPVSILIPELFGFGQLVSGLLTYTFIISYPYIFFAIDSFVIARARIEANRKQTPTYRDSFFTKEDSRLPSQETLNALNSVAEMDESMLRLLRGARPLEFGEVVGTYRNQPIHSWIRTVDGSFYDYDHALPLGTKYGFPANGTLVLPPGLFYVKRSTE